LAVAEQRIRTGVEEFPPLAGGHIEGVVLFLSMPSI
jgi:hypothetical protein